MVAMTGSATGCITSRAAMCGIGNSGDHALARTEWRCRRRQPDGFTVVTMLTGRREDPASAADVELARRYLMAAGYRSDKAVRCITASR